MLPAINLDPSLQPVVDRLHPKTAAAFRAFVQQSFAQAAPTVDKMPAIEASMLLMGEGQTPPNPSVGGTIAAGALKLGRPSMVLISDSELRSMALAENQTAKLTALDKRIGQDTIAYLLDLRAKGGPTGRQFEQLYAARRGGDLHNLGAELMKRGVFVSAQILNTDAIKYLLGSRLEATLKKDAAASAFVLMSLDALVGNDGIIAALRKSGNSVNPISRAGSAATGYGDNVCDPE